MKLCLFLSTLIICLLCTQRGKAQDISKLNLPVSPAFSILDFEPSAVMRPTNAKSLASDVLNSFDKDGKLLMNLGLEAAPYWLGSHPHLKMKKYLDPDFGQTFLQSFSLSAATVKDTVSGDNKFGAGFRFKLLNGEPVQSVQSATTIRNLKTRTMIANIISGRGRAAVAADTRQSVIKDIEAVLVAKNVSPIIIDDFIDAAQNSMDDYSDTITDIQAFLTDLATGILNGQEYRELQEKVSELLYERKGLVIEFAGAGGYNASDKMSLETIGFWGNISYYVSVDDLFTLTARYMSRNMDTSLRNFDVGLGYLKKTRNYNVSVEGMWRWYKAEIPDINISGEPILRLEKKFTYRLAIQGSYSITKDISINLNIGKDFDSPFISGSGFFSILGLNYSIFSKDPPQLK
jgi:hypothetical protein